MKAHYCWMVKHQSIIPVLNTQPMLAEAEQTVLYYYVPLKWQDTVVRIRYNNYTHVQLTIGRLLTRGFIDLRLPSLKLLLQTTGKFLCRSNKSKFVKFLREFFNTESVTQRRKNRVFFGGFGCYVIHSSGKIEINAQQPKSERKR